MLAEIENDPTLTERRIVMQVGLLHRLVSIVALGLALAGVSSAQTTWHVDVNNAAQFELSRFSGQTVEVMVTGRLTSSKLFATRDFITIQN